MNQQDIFSLLLVILLISNRQMAENDSATQEGFSYTLINDILILSLVLKGFSDESCNKNNTTF